MLVCILISKNISITPLFLPRDFLSGFDTAASFQCGPHPAANTTSIAATIITTPYNHYRSPITSYPAARGSTDCGWGETRLNQTLADQRPNHRASLLTTG